MPSLISIEEIKNNSSTDNAKDNFRAYRVVSTAKTTVEENLDSSDRPSEDIKEIVEYLLECKSKNPKTTVDIVVQIHGYNTGEGYKKDYDKAQARIAAIQNDDQSPDSVVIFLGYSWPSEKFILSNPLLLINAFKALPGWLNIASFLGLIWVIANSFTISRSWILEQLNGMGNATLELFEDIKNAQFTQLFSGSGFSEIIWLVVKWLSFLVAGITTIIFISSLVLILLRVTVYFRDSYRATHYGVPDLIQFFRVFEYLIKQLDQTKLYPKNSIKLSFVGHSMGGFVTTNLIRVLSDVFDQPSNANFSDPNDPALAIIDGKRIISKKEAKRSNVGEYFTLERLVLVSPDIPVNAILSGRSNFLSSSLTRFQESYLFSNEGDMVLLLLSTVANYISFPSMTPQMGYKLGNLGVKKDNKKDDSAQRYLMSEFAHIDYLEHKNHTGNVLHDLVIGIDHKDLSGVSSTEPYIAQEFTYFDCTDYLRRELFPKNQNLNNYRTLKLLNYAALVLKLSQTHGGYFDFEETQDAIYTIACKGFDYFEGTSTGRQTLQGMSGIKVLKADNFPRKIQNND
jgi:hypothetical protein